MAEDRFCECGCGMKTKLATQTNRKKGWVKGEPLRSINGHLQKLHKGDKAFNWKGGKHSHLNRTLVFKPDHHRAMQDGYVKNSILVVEEVTGLKIKKPTVIHHIDEDSMNDSPSNFVVCENQAYHNFIHKRKRAYDACGNVNWLKCPFCKEYDNPDNLHIKGAMHYHNRCANEYNKIRYRKKVLKQTGRCV
uniref:Putative HNH endonuclease n=1 Tax=viral metagenome TaxID=1070528 RepID=A0A6M3LBL2_9ZZZZ